MGCWSPGIRAVSGSSIADATLPVVHMVVEAGGSTPGHIHQGACCGRNADLPGCDWLVVTGRAPLVTCTQVYHDLQ